MARDLWLLKRPAIVTEKIRENLTVDAATYNCGIGFGSHALLEDTNLFFGNVDASQLTEKEHTLEFWWKFVNPLNTVTSRDIVFISSATQYYTKVRINGTTGQLSILLADNVPTLVTLNTGYYPQLGVWTHYAVTREYAAGTTTIKLYINGDLVYTGTDGTLNGNNLTAPWYVFVGDQTSSSVYLKGYISMLRVWNSVRTADEIKSKYTTVVGGNSDVNSSLLMCFPMSYSADAVLQLSNLGSEPESVYKLYLGSYNIALSDSVYPDAFYYGASFIVAKWTFSIDTKFSLVWPNTPPEGTTGQMCVSWTDDEGEFQRRRLWTTAGVSIAPEPAIYMGEPLGEDAALELWNIDGNATAVIPEDLIFYISKTTDPTNSYDHESQTAATLTADTTLAEAFPLTPFPLQFNEQQTY